MVRTLLLRQRLGVGTARQCYANRVPREPNEWTLGELTVKLAMPAPTLYAWMQKASRPAVEPSGRGVWDAFADWVPYGLAQRQDLLVAIDWTDFDPDGQGTVVRSLVIDHGRTTLLLWRTIAKAAPT